MHGITLNTVYRLFTVLLHSVLTGVLVVTVFVVGYCNGFVFGRSDDFSSSQIVTKVMIFTQLLDDFFKLETLIAINSQFTFYNLKMRCVFCQSCQ